MAGGRPKDTPTKRLSAGWKEKMLDLARGGASDVELRAELGISEDLWYRWIEEEPEFSVTIKSCKVLCQVWWEKTGRKMASGSESGNATVWIFNMKNRFNWRDKQDVEHSGHIDFSNMTEDEIERRIATLASRKD